MGKHSRDMMSERQENTKDNSMPENDNVEETTESVTHESETTETHEEVKENTEEKADEGIDSSSSEEVETPVDTAVDKDSEDSHDDEESDDYTSSQVVEKSATGRHMDGVKAQTGGSMLPIRISMSAPNTMILAGLHSETGANSIGAYVKYTRLKKLIDVTGLLAFLAIVVAITAELFTYTTYSIYTLPTATTLLITGALLVFWIIMRNMLDLRVDNILSDSDRSTAHTVLGLLATLALFSAISLLFVRVLIILNGGTLELNSGGTGFGGFINDYSLMNSAPAGALVQTLPLIIFIMSGIMGIVTGLVYAFGRKNFVSEFDSMGDFKALYKTGNAYLTE